MLFVTETEYVYCAVRTVYIYIIWAICFIWISEQTTIISLYDVYWMLFVTETECVWCVVRAEYTKVALLLAFHMVKGNTANYVCELRANTAL